MKLITFFRYFYFHRFRQCPNLRGWTSHSFSIKVLHVLSSETSTSTAAVFFFKCYATRQDLFKLGWRIGGKHKQQNLSNHVLNWSSYLRLDNRNATRTLRIIIRIRDLPRQHCQRSRCVNTPYHDQQLHRF